MSSNNAASYMVHSHLLQEEVFFELISGIDIKSGFRCLDVGCGTGNFTKLLVDLVGEDGYVLGIDPDQGRIDHAKEMYFDIPNLEFLCVSAGNMSTDFPKFDVVSSSCVIHWMKDNEKWKTFQNVFDLLKSGGKFAFNGLLEMPKNMQLIYNRVRDKEKVQHILNLEFSTLEEYESNLIKVGFAIENIETRQQVCIFKTLIAYLTWLNTSEKCEADIEEVVETHKSTFKLEQCAKGRYIHRYKDIYTVVKKPF